jgi:hypothetical protein
MVSGSIFPTEFSLEELGDFIILARQQGYAGGVAKVETPQRPGFKEFPIFKKDDFSYLDSYAGWYFFPGQEVVRFKEKPVWIMSYSGGAIPNLHGDPENVWPIYEFLKTALNNPPKDYPFRGPSVFDSKNANYRYFNNWSGDLSFFRGAERIIDLTKGETVFYQDYIGGLVVNK